MSVEGIRTVGILGTGTIGASWAAFYALHGLEVRLFDENAEALARGTGQARQHLVRLVELGLAEAEAADGAVLEAVDSLAALATGVDFIQESVAETYDAKLPLFVELDALLPVRSLVASSSSGLLISRLQDVMQHPGRAFIAHPFNPPHLVPLVELVSGRHTDPAVIDRARAFFLALGKEPVVLHREVPGHIANRLAAALWREAIDLVAQGVASVEDVDTALRAGPGLRWAIMGQHLTYHLGGGLGGYAVFIDHIGKSFEAYWASMADWTEIPDEARDAVLAGIDRATRGRSGADLVAERDRKLAAVLRALDEAGRNDS